MAYFICDFQKQQGTPSEYIGNGLYFYFSVLSLRKAADSRLSADCVIKEIMFPSGIGFKNIILKKYPL
jgi:hypothetical protein